MKTITLTQPYATLVAIGAKRIETRGWATSHRGPLAIHAAKGFPKAARALCSDPIFSAALEKAGYEHFDDLPLGAVVGICTLVEVQEMNILHVFPACQSFTTQKTTWKLDEQERAFGYYAVGRYMWLLNDVAYFPKPIQAKGYQRIWNWDIPYAGEMYRS